MRHFTRLLCLSAVLLSGACQHKPEPAPISLSQHIEQKQAELSWAVGRLTLDEAITRWGQPARVVEGKELTSVLWRQSAPGHVAVVPLPVTRGLSPIVDTMPGYVDVPGHGEQLDCTFVKESSLLRSVKYSAW